jgi:ApaG protein
MREQPPTSTSSAKEGDPTAYEQTTRSIKVTVEPFFLEDQSNPSENHFVWAYRVRIDNLGAARVQLRNRYWHIADGFGRVQEVSGAGVVGEQPMLGPGESFEYTSGTPLPTPSGIMKGHYEMEGADGERFRITIPPFSLDSPYDKARVH